MTGVICFLAKIIYSYTYNSYVVNFTEYINLSIFRIIPLFSVRKMCYLSEKKNNFKQYNFKSDNTISLTKYTIKRQ